LLILAEELGKNRRDTLCVFFFSLMKTHVVWSMKRHTLCVLRKDKDNIIFFFV
jgi:hypothetical protein